MSFKTLFVREVKAFIKNPVFLVSVIIIIATYLSIGRLATVGAEVARRERAEAVACFVTDLHEDLVLKTIELTNRTFRVRTFASIEEALRECKVVFRIKNVVVNTTGYTGSIHLDTRIIIEELNPSLYYARTSFVESIIRRLEESLPLAYSLTHNVSIPLDVKVNSSNTALFQGKAVSFETFSTMLSTASFTPFIVGFVIGLTASNASFITAVEKDEKAFELLLAQPIPRRTIVLAKITASVVVSIMYGLAILASLLVAIVFTIPGYSTSYSEAYSDVTVAIHYSSPTGFLSSMIPVIVYSITVGMVNAGALGVIVGSIVSDTRSASVLSSPLIMIYFGLGFVTMFTGLPISIYTSAIYGSLVVMLPYVYVYSTLTGMGSYFVSAITASIASTIALIILATLIFEKDIVVTGLRIRLKKYEAKP